MGFAPRAWVLAGVAWLAGPPLAGQEVLPAPQAISASSAGFTRTADKLLYARLTSGAAISLEEARRALSVEGEQAQVNMIHALGAHARRADIKALLRAVWEGREEADTAARSPAVRLALAGVLAFADAARADEYLAYARAFLQGEQPLLVAVQAITALGLGGLQEDVPYLEHFVADGHPLIVQAAVTALVLMRSLPARDALIRQLERFRGDARGALIQQVLRDGYDWPPRQRLAPPEPAPAAP